MENEVAAPVAGASAEPELVPAPGGCASCGAAMAPDQDWCLNCGTAAPGRVEDRIGMRTAARVGVLTLALLVTAVGASYAALTHGSKTTLVAAAPPVVAPAPATTATTPAPKTTAAPAPKTPTTTSDDVPVAPDNTPTVTPDDTFTTTPTDDTSTVTPTTTVTPTPTPRVTPTTKTTTTRATKVTLAKNAIVLYDPFTRAIGATDPAALTDKDPSTVWTVSTAPSADGMRVGLTIDLSTVRRVTQIRLQTPTPGFSVEIYGAPGPTSTTGPQFPQTVPGPGWTHLRNGADLGSVDGNATISLGIHGKGVSTYRYLLVWLTHQPPAAAGTRDVPVTATDATPTDTTPTVPVTTPPVTTTDTTTTPPPLGVDTVSIAELSVFG